MERPAGVPVALRRARSRSMVSARSGTWEGLVQESNCKTSLPRWEILRKAKGDSGVFCCCCWGKSPVGIQADLRSKSLGREARLSRGRQGAALGLLPRWGRGGDEELLWRGLLNPAADCAQ